MSEVSDCGMVPGVNEALLREVLAFIELHPENWKQFSWFTRNPLLPRRGTDRVDSADTALCGTTACLAGWTVILGLPEFGLDNLHLFHREAVDIEGVAQHLLGLTDQQASDLFYFMCVRHRLGTDDLESHAPTFVEFCERVEQVTGVRFKPAQAGLDAP